MSYVHLGDDGQIDNVSSSAYFVSKSDEDITDPEVMAAHGWHEVVDVPRPDDTATHTAEYEVQLVSGIPTVVWVPREWTTEELAERNRIQNEATLRAGVAAIITRAQERQTAMQGLIDTVNSTINQNPATYLRILARADKRRDADIIRLARLVGGLTDSASVGDET